MDDEFSAHLQELRRGTIVLACLELLRTPGYGYGLLQELERRGFTTDANTLYPLLRRLQKQGHLSSEWNTDEARPRKFYRTSPEGERLGEALTQEWWALSHAITQLAIVTPGGSGSSTPAPGSTDAGAPADALSSGQESAARVDAQPDTLPADHLQDDSSMSLPPANAARTPK
ncbi:MAG: PadR family transcriptional regulator [Pauljensenia sp.]